jgi:hypothetical protein
VPRVAGQPASAIRDCGIDNPNHGAPGCDGIYRGMQRAKKLAIVVACAPASKLDGLSCQMRF